MDWYLDGHLLPYNTGNDRKSREMRFKTHIVWNTRLFINVLIRGRGGIGYYVGLRFV